MNRSAPTYNDHLDTLTALITYLGLTSFRSRTPRGLAESLGLDESSVVNTLDGFPGLFRKGSNPSPRTGQLTYTLHARYALREGATPEAAEDTGNSPSLPPELLRALLDHVVTRAQAERELRTSASTNRLTLIGVTVAAIASIIAAVVAGVGS
jgi:hypothetical protein